MSSGTPATNPKRRDPQDWQQRLQHSQSPQHPHVARHWRASLRLTSALLAVWFAATFVVVFFARELSATLAGWPFSFWVAAQGAPLLYAVLVALYARVLDRLDRRCGVAEPD